jgi:hypothetical protein
VPNIDVPVPPILWSCDPAKKKNALAVFHRGVLGYTAFLPSDRNISPVGAPAMPVVLVTEKMRVYPPKAKKGRGAKANPNDLLDVERAAGRLEGIVLASGGSIVEPYLAADWKGQIDKPTHHMRIWTTLLTDEERAVFAKCVGKSVAEVDEILRTAVREMAATGEAAYSWAAHNLFDAVGLGLFHLKRAGRAGVKARHWLNRGS